MPMFCGDGSGYLCGILSVDCDGVLQQLPSDLYCYLCGMLFM